jgi:hypothetical protein
MDVDAIVFANMNLPLRFQQVSGIAGWDINLRVGDTVVELCALRVAAQLKRRKPLAAIEFDLHSWRWVLEFRAGRCRPY